MDQQTRYIASGCDFESLPPDVRQSFGSKNEWKKSVLEYALAHQLRYRRSLVRKVFQDEMAYYERLLEYSKDHFMLYPYHLADAMVLKCKTTAFDYYVDILSHMLETDRSYDTLPNFTASDCLLLLGIGRNEYIDLMTKIKSGKGLFRKRIHPRPLLPSQPLFPEKMEYWWRVGVGHVLEGTVRELTPSEKATLDRVIEQGLTPAGSLDRDLLVQLFQKNLFYLEVPINESDCVVIPPLEGFVMNRVLGDYLETLLYQIFVSIDQQTTVKEIADILQIDLQQAKDAVSIYCRLGFARKRLPPVNVFQLHKTWNDVVKSKSQKSSNVNDLSEIMESLQHRKLRIAFLFDSTLAAFLMMGNLSPGLKKHAVTLFEAGKLPDETVLELLAELSLTEVLMDGHAREYSTHAIALRETLQFLRKNWRLHSKSQEDDHSSTGLDMLRCESLAGLSEDTQQRVLTRNYMVSPECLSNVQLQYYEILLTKDDKHDQASFSSSHTDCQALIGMSPLNQDVGSLMGASCLPTFGTSRSEFGTPWFKLFIYSRILSGPESLLLVSGTVLTRLPQILTKYSYVLLTTWKHEPVLTTAASLLFALNEALAQGPVFVQGLAQFGENVEIVRIPCNIPSVSYLQNILQEELQMESIRTMAKTKHDSSDLYFTELQPPSACQNNTSQQPQQQHLDKLVPNTNSDLQSNVALQEGDDCTNNISTEDVCTGTRSQETEKDAPYESSVAAPRNESEGFSPLSTDISAMLPNTIPLTDDQVRNLQVQSRIAFAHLLMEEPPTPLYHCGNYLDGDCLRSVSDNKHAVDEAHPSEEANHDTFLQNGQLIDAHLNSENEPATNVSIDEQTVTMMEQEKGLLPKLSNLNGSDVSNVSHEYKSSCASTYASFIKKMLETRELDHLCEQLCLPSCIAYMTLAKITSVLQPTCHPSMPHNSEKNALSHVDNFVTPIEDHAPADKHEKGTLIHNESSFDMLQFRVDGHMQDMNATIAKVPDTSCELIDLSEDTKGSYDNKLKGLLSDSKHSSAPTGGSGCAAPYQNTNHVMLRILDIGFGVPLFDQHLNAALLLAMEERTLLDENNLAEVCSFQNTLTEELYEFILRNEGCMEDLSGSAVGAAIWPLPSRHLHFDGKSLSFIDLD